MSDTPRVLLEVAHRIATLTLNRPETRNAIDGAMRAALLDHLEDLAADDGVDCVILTGAGGKAFAAGADIGELSRRQGPDALAGYNARLFEAVEDFPRPTIAAIVGYALGGGCELALACDLRVAGRGARLGQPEVGLGIMAAAGGTYRLPRLVGPAVAKELLFTGEIIDAERAKDIGLVNHVVPDDEVVSTAREIGERITQNSRHAVRLSKLAVNAWSRGGQVAWRAMEDAAQHILYDDPESTRRMKDFLEKKSKGKKS